MAELEITPATIAIALVIIALVAFAIHRLRSKGLCDCKECNHESGGCPGCNSVEKMIADMEKATKAGQ